MQLCQNHQQAHYAAMPRGGILWLLSLFGGALIKSYRDLQREFATVASRVCQTLR
jgi:hypothetical protein